MLKTPAPPRRRSRIAHFKAPFVISVAAPALFGVACGGEAEPASLDQTALAGQSREPGSPCDDEGSLQPGSGNACPASVCLDGHWTTIPTCNPPPPEEPTCDGLPPASPDPECPSTPRCEDGEWVLDFVACNPPPPAPECPAELPTAGDSCAGYDGLTCEYEFCYGGLAPLVTCSAVTGLWEDILQPPCNPPPPPCFADFSCGASADAGAPGSEVGASDGGG